MSVMLADFEDADRQIIERLYAELQSVLAMLKPGAVNGKALLEHCQAPEWRSLMTSMKVFGQATYDMRPHPDIKKVMHDLRGGPLAVLFLRLQTVGHEVGPDEATKLLKLAREHLELMRTRVPDLSEFDPSVRRQNGVSKKAP
ncbi:MAG TPA: hypothetical protein VK459_11200 [Polyangiaceae bacterium]|jgi:hypothetical protein|nr:hypothetical protein [Polyangiaceae bacterium]